MHGINIASLVATHSHKNAKVRNGGLARQKKREKELVCSTNTHCPSARFWADKTPAEKMGQVQTLPSRVSEARNW